MKVGINGFGRIGKLVYRNLVEKGIKVPIVNDPVMTTKAAVYGLNHDSVHQVRPFHGGIGDAEELNENSFRFRGNETQLTTHRNPEDIPWEDVDFVVESSGFFLKSEDCQSHIGTSNRRVLITAPSPDAPMFVFGVNHEEITRDHRVISNASCTTNCLAPIAKVLNQKFGIKQGLMSTIHAMTSSQKTVDGFSSKNLGLGRSAQNIILSSTGAAKAVGKVIPDLDGKLTGMAFRVPVSDVSVVDLTVELEKETTLEQIFEAFEKSGMDQILSTTSEKLVSSDFIGSSFSSVVAKDDCIALNSTFFKIIAWYDNEWAYSCRVVDILQYMFSN